MTVQSATSSMTNFSGEYGSWMTEVTLGKELFLREKSLHLVDRPESSTSTYGSTASASANQTVAHHFMLLHQLPGYDEYFSVAGDTLSVSYPNYLEIATETSANPKYSFFEQIFGYLAQVKYIIGDLPKSSWVSIQEDEDLDEEAFIRAHYDIVPPRTHEDFLKAREADMALYPRRKYVDIDVPMIDDDGDD
jgi:hypothetical protein